MRSLHGIKRGYPQERYLRENAKVVEGSEKLLHLTPVLTLQPPPYLSPPPPAPVAPNTLSAIPLPQLLPGRGQALISRVLQTASLVFSHSRGREPRPTGPS